MRQFGIELELIAPTDLIRSQGDALAAAKHILQAAGLDARTNSYSGRDYARWQCKADGSIRPADRGVEVVSRIMPGDESAYGEVNRAVTALDNAGFGINRSCGFHVHVNVADLPMSVRQLIVLRYAQMQSGINAMLPPSRRSNDYCQPISDAHRVNLAALVDTGRDGWANIGRGVTNIAHANLDGNSRIEFRQAAGTCNAAKVVGWVRFLQEMIEEVARRAAQPGVIFGRGGMTAPVRPVAPPVVRPAAMVPRMRVGSDAHRALEQLAATGVVSAAWAFEQGVAIPVLRRIIVGFRRHGADINTVSTGSGPSYVLNGARNLPMSFEQVFASGMAAPVAPAPARWSAMSSPAPSVTLAAAFVNYAFEAGFTPGTAAWVRDRRDTFNADRDSGADSSNAARF